MEYGKDGIIRPKKRPKQAKPKKKKTTAAAELASMPPKRIRGGMSPGAGYVMGGGTKVGGGGRFRQKTKKPPLS